MNSKKTIIDKFEGTNAFLSNFHAAHPFHWKGDDWKTAEHAFQAAKCADPLDYFRVRDSATPGRAKALGRKVKLAVNWDKRKLMVILEVLRAKFNPAEQTDMAEALLATGSAHLIYGNDVDVFWGVDAKTGVGQNQLGIALMITREWLKSLANRRIIKELV